MHFEGSEKQSQFKAKQSQSAGIGALKAGTVSIGFRNGVGLFARKIRKKQAFLACQRCSQSEWLRFVIV